MKNNVNEQMEQLKECGENFSIYVQNMKQKEMGSNKPELMEAWKKILSDQHQKIHALLKALREGIVWSMLDDRKEEFKEVKQTLNSALMDYKGYVTEEEQQKIQETLQLLTNAADGFRKSYLGEGYYEEVFDLELERYRQENSERVELVYMQDFNRMLKTSPDEQERKYKLEEKCRERLYKTEFGEFFHDYGEKKDKLVYYVIEQREKDRVKIDSFLNAYLAWEVAKAHLEEAQEEVPIENLVFKENVNVGKVMKKLGEFKKKKVFSSHRQWYIAYKVFKKKNWLANDIQTHFIDQLHRYFKETICSSEDFGKVNSYFKSKDYTKWTTVDNKAPRGCKYYRAIADLLDQEFQDWKYALPGKLINTRGVELR